MADEALRQGVVAAIGRADGRWLLVKRAAGLSRAPGRVGFPGGQVERGETQRQAVVREIREELGLIVEVGPKFWQSAQRVPGFVLHGYLATVVGGTLQPDPAEVAEVLWLTPQEAIDHPEAFEGNPEFLRALQSCQENHP